MFCSKCGSEIKEGALFCGNCGQRVDIANGSCENEDPSAYYYEGSSLAEGSEAVPDEPKKKKRYGLTIAVIIIAGVVIIAALLIFAFVFLRAAADDGYTGEEASDYKEYTSGFDSYEEVLDQCMTSIMDADLSGLFLTVPEEVLEAELEGSGYSSDELDEYLSDYNDTLDTAWSYLDTFLGSWTLTYNIVAEYEITGSELEDIRETYSEYGIDVESAVYAEVELVVTSEEYEVEGLLDLDTIGFYFIETDGLWYLDIYSIDW